MKFVYRNLTALFVVLLFLVQTAVASAAGAQGNVNGIRFSSGPTAVRIVFDVDVMPDYKVSTANDGTRLILDFPATENHTDLKNLDIDDSLVKSVIFSKNNQGFQAIIELNRAATYSVKTLQGPPRIFIDISKNYESKQIDEVAPGLIHTTYVRNNDLGMLTAHVLDVDPTLYNLRPALSNGKISGRETVSGISDDTNAMAAVNSSYFALNGELLGLTKIDSTIVSTTYLARSAFGIMPDGTPIAGVVDYTGTVSSKGVTLPISGVNCERGENGLTIYNSYYDDSTMTNEYGMEYTVKGNKVIDIKQANSPILPGTIVVSAHGTAKDALASVKIGDRMEIKEDIGSPWNTAQQIIGVGPTLVKAGNINVTAQQEQFGGDVTGGRAPRTAVGITQNKHVLLFVVDGRQNTSIGCTLTEMGQLMKDFGVVDAVNFDGGGSSEMVIGSTIVNSPSDGSERKVGAALIVIKK